VHSVMETNVSLVCALLYLFYVFCASISNVDNLLLLIQMKHLQTLRTLTQCHHLLSVQYINLTFHHHFQLLLTARVCML